MKPQRDRRGGTAPLDDRAFVVSLKPIVALDVQRWGLANEDFRPTLEELLIELETNPYQFPVKRRGKLHGARAADITYRVWRVVFDIEDDDHEVVVLAMAAHDDAYRQAERRRA